MDPRLWIFSNMGRGEGGSSYARAVVSVSASSSANSSAASRVALSQQRSFASQLNPLRKNVSLTHHRPRAVCTPPPRRGKNDSSSTVLGAALWCSVDPQVVCAAQTPIVLALDISGSMSEWPRVFYDKMPMFYGSLVMQGYVPDPAVSFAAFAGGKQLQASEFGQGVAIDGIIKKMWLCGGGGDGEPYAGAPSPAPASTLHALLPRLI